MHIHILGICGTFMGSLAILAKELGYKVTGSDDNVYPPMSTQLEAQGIKLMQGYVPEHLQPIPDLVIIGNAMKRGNLAVEYVLNQNIPYTSGPQWLSEQVLQKYHVLAVAGTHGKTTTSSMLAWVLEAAGLNPSFLIGGVPQNFTASARLTDSKYFVIEADEYDTAFFDKRSKFVHYHARTTILNNLEYDHADIFPDLAAIERQFHHLVRIIPSKGLIIYPSSEKDLQRVIEMGCWTPVQTTGDGDWQARLLAEDGSQFEVFFQNTFCATVNWELTGLHNVNNALACIAAANHINIAPQEAIKALGSFKNVKRRMEKIAEVNGITIYDDFAHHPTAIATTLDGLRKHIGTDTQLIAIIEPRSNSMKLGAHREELAESVSQADQAIWYAPESLGWDLATTVKHSPAPTIVCDSLETIIEIVKQQAKSGTHIVVMSNGGFGGIHQKLVRALS